MGKHTRLFKSDKSAKVDILRYAEDAGLNNYSLNIRSDYTAKAGILQFSKEADSDMIAMGTHAWKGLIHLFLGSVSEHVVGQSNMPGQLISNDLFDLTIIIHRIDPHHLQSVIT